jgi:hypothetical protein
MRRRRFLVFAVLSTVLGGGVLLLRRWLDYHLLQTEIARLGTITVLSASLAIIPREEWQAREPNHEATEEFGFSDDTNITGWKEYIQPLQDVYHTVAIHHSASSVSNFQTMREIQDLHMDQRGWADIGYHFGIDASGQIYEGRRIGVRGASVAGFNEGVIGVMVMGNFEWEAPLDVQLAALQNLVNGLAETYQLSHLSGHGEINIGTLCPGRFLRLYLDLLAEGAGLARGLGASSPL